jgi:hypothetical protein
MYLNYKNSNGYFFAVDTAAVAADANVAVNVVLCFL